MAYAIIRSGGKQFRVEPEQTIHLPLVVEKQIGDSLDLEVLVLGADDGTVSIGSPAVAGARVAATIVEHGREKKIIVFKKKRRKQYKRTQGHRQDYTAIKIDSIS